MAAIARSALRTRAHDRMVATRAKEAARRTAYRLVELRDGMHCRACGVRLVKTLTVQPNRLEHHHIRGRVGKEAESTRNLVCLCKTCHDQRHVTRTLTITGNADSTLEFERDRQSWHG